MADLPELNEWTPGVYQLETSDPVLGGPEGIDNLQAKQLANRTLWLKGKFDALSNGATAAGKASKLATARAISISGAASGTANFDGASNVEIALTLADLPWSKVNSGKPTTLGGYGITDAFTKPEANAAIQQAISNLVASSPAALDTLNELAAALGNDPNFATTMTNALAGKASKATSLAGYGITDAYTKAGTYSKAEVEALLKNITALPVGAMVPFPVGTVPPGFLEANGGSRSIAEYPDLAAYLGTTFNKGDEGAGNFRLPDSRGEFLRGWDHGRGVDAGRAIGSWQEDMFKSHTHRLQYGSQAGGNWGSPGYAALGQNSSNGIEATGGSETRPRNLAVMWCIKAWNAPINQGNIDVAALAASIPLAMPKHYFSGFALSLNAAAATTTIDVAPGSARVTGNPVTLNGVLSGVLQSAGAWAAGFGVNKLDTGARAASTWYHVFIIRNLAGGDGDLLFSASLAAPLVPAGFEVIRRIGSVKTDSSANIVPFINVGRHFWWVTPIKDAAGSLTTTSEASLALTLSVPPGVRVLSKFHAAFTGNATNLYARSTDASQVAVKYLVSNAAAALVNWNVGLGMNTTDIDFGSFPFEVLSDITGTVVLQYSQAPASGFYSVASIGYTELY